MLRNVLILLLCEQIMAYDKPLYDLELSHEYFEAFRINFNVSYADELEYIVRFKTFRDNLEQINLLNKREPHAVFAINKFSDLTPEEFVARHTGYNREAESSKMAENCRVVSDDSISTQNAPDALDWRTKNAVTRVKDQLDCGSCWTFSATGAIEGAYAIKHHQLLELSEQELLDCDPIGTCTGGYPMSAFETVKKLGGQMLEQDYSYEHQKTSCRFNKNKAKVRVSECIQFQLSKEELIKKALAVYGPLSIGIDSEAPAVQSYHSGIVKECHANEINHAVLLVGFGTEQGVPYWVVKNSFGSTWGEKGYIRLMRGINACGLTETIATVTVE